MDSIDLKKYSFETSLDERGVSPYFVVRFKDFDNVVGTGDTIEEAISDAFDVLEEEIEYRNEKHLSIPAPSSNTIQDVSGRITLRMPKSLHRKLIAFAAEEGVSLNSAIDNILAEHLAASECKRDVFDPGSESFVFYAGFNHGINHDPFLNDWEESNQRKWKDIPNQKQNGESRASA